VNIGNSSYERGEEEGGGGEGKVRNTFRVVLEKGKGAVNH